MRASKKLKACTFTLALVFCVAAAAITARAQSDGEGESSADKASASAAVRQLTGRDPTVRQRGAEELARLAAPDRRKLVEGYRLQEKNERVKLAMDWALYRMGKDEALFAVVRALASPRYNQAYAYLTALDGPEPLYVFLQRADTETEVKLLEVLARVGNEETVELIKPYAASLDPKIAGAADFATREITLRLAQTPGTDVQGAARPRKTGRQSEDSQP